MIVIYSPIIFDDDKINSKINQLKDRLSIFFVDDNDFIYTTETNQKLLRELIINHQPNLFFTDSLKDIKFTPTEICELIIFLLKNNCDFQSESDNIYFTKKDIDIIYPNIFEYFRQYISK